MKNILIIPARGGSKRIPRKNIKLFKGKPIIERTIEIVFKLDIFDKLIVSTDDEEIASIAKRSGAEVPFVRPLKLSDDHASTRDVIIHALEWYKKRNIDYKYVCCLYPTSPLLKSKYLLDSINLLVNSDESGYVFSATKFTHPIQRAFYLDKKEKAKMFFKENFQKRTQDLKAAYHDAGQFYLASSDTWFEKSNIFEGSIPYILPNWRAVDIDNLEDWKLAELFYEININDKLS